MDRRKDKSNHADDAAPPPASEDSTADDRDVGAKLRAMFKAVEQAPVPDEITRLVNELERQRTNREPKRN